MKPQQKAAPGGTGAAENNTSELSSHSTPSLCRQARRVLDLLRAGPLSTCDLIAAGILRPGARVFDLRCAGFDRVALAKAYEVGFTVTCGPSLPTPSPSPLEKYTCAYRRRWTQACAGLLPVCGRRARRHAVHVPQPEHLQGQCAHAGTDKPSQCQRLTPTLSALAAACGGHESS